MHNVVNFEKRVEGLGTYNYKILKNSIRVKSGVGDINEINSFAIRAEFQLESEHSVSENNTKTVYNVSFKMEEAMDIVKILLENEVSPLHLEDIINDHIFVINEKRETMIETSELLLMAQ